LRILIVAPRPAPGLPALDIMSELRGIMRDNQVSMCDGAVDRAKLDLALSERYYDVVHFVQHGARGVLEYEDGPLDKAELVAMLKRTQTALRFLVLNSCDSIAMGVILHNALMIPIVVVNTNVEDKVALRFSEALYRNLDSGLNLENAVESARQTLLQLFGPMANAYQLINGSHDTILALAAKLDECSITLKSEVTLIREELKDAIGDLHAETTALKIAVDSLRVVGSVHIRRSVTALMVLLILLIAAQILTPFLNALTLHGRP
jgi:hypothetical protein